MLSEFPFTLSLHIPSNRLQFSIHDINLAFLAGVFEAYFDPLLTQIANDSHAEPHLCGETLGAFFSSIQSIREFPSDRIFRPMAVVVTMIFHVR